MHAGAERLGLVDDKHAEVSNSSNKLRTKRKVSHEYVGTASSKSCLPMDDSDCYAAHYQAGRLPVDREVGSGSVGRFERGTVER